VKRWQLSDHDSHAILEAVGPPPKGARPARARRELAKCLRDYPGMPRDRAKLRASQARWQRIHRLTTELHAILTEEWQRGWTYNALVDDAFKKYLLPSTAIWTEYLAMRVRDHKGRRDPAREWLYLELLHIWIYYLRGELKASRSATGGPCVRFVRVAMALVLPAADVPSVDTVHDIVGKLRRGQALGLFRFDPVVGAQRPWRR
jgi:hypothetical protein